MMRVANVTFGGKNFMGHLRDANQPGALILLYYYTFCESNKMSQNVAFSGHGRFCGVRQMDRASDVKNFIVRLS